MPPNRATDTAFSRSAESQPASRRIAPTLLAFGCLGLVGSAVLARSPEDALSGQVRLYTRTIPRFVSDRQATTFYRNESVEVVRRAVGGTWEAEIVAFLDEPLDDFEVTLVFHDVSNGARRFIKSTTVMVHDRDTRVVRKRIVLRQPEFNPRRWYEVVVMHRRQPLTRAAQFFADGVVDSGPQVVVFEEEEAQPTGAQDAFADL